MEDVVKNNRFLAGAQVDVKGHRMLRPLQQEDPDMYVHVTEERSDGIIVRGAKIHTTAAMVADGLFVLPGRALRAGEEDYAIAFALPVNAEGLRLICRPAMGVEMVQHPMEGGTEMAIVESLVIFDDVFVPWEHVFVYKDPENAGRLALLFALWHRLSAVSYRAALADYLVGLGKLIAEANGVEGAPHIQRDVVELINFAEIQKLCAKMAAYEGIEDKKSGVVIPNPIYTNVGKLYSNANYMNVRRALIDIAGGLAITAPSGDDYDNKELRKDIGKYLRGAIPGEDRFKLFLVLRQMLAIIGGEEEVTMLHAEGSMRASEFELYRTYDYSDSRKLIEKLLSRMV